MLRSALTVVGAVLMVLGIFFTLQGAGVIMWPPESFMLADRGWVSKGLMIAAAGAAVILISRRVGSKS
ncbi:hypothetical protein [Novosphingobium sp. TH158]|uniref:hypothetical protein n=1 Tax=Novosphingobium sp. TH158 TaxID=2067455 RepID=UPI000C7CD129|nr:hypothetical protein [Novosphingobium sp. TH158]PLK25819.1 hypothetical protein C0V78_02100 [Novosphingobium sp. TH158]